MELIEKKLLAEVSIHHANNMILVRWDNCIFKGEECISRIPHRKCYSQEKIAEFRDEIENAQTYIDAIGWV